MIFRDKFVVGDKVTWRDDYYAEMLDGRRECGNGPFTIIKVVDVLFRDEEWGDHQSNHSGMGHTQQVYADCTFASDGCSGAFFKII